MYLFITVYLSLYIYIFVLKRYTYTYIYVYMYVYTYIYILLSIHIFGKNAGTSTTIPKLELLDAQPALALHNATYKLPIPSHEIHGN